MPAFEVYLQFDSFERDALMALRGADLRRMPRAGARAPEPPRHLDDARGDGEEAASTTTSSGSIVDFALTQPCVRGVTFQPMQDAGRLERLRPGGATG